MESFKDLTKGLDIRLALRPDEAATALGIGRSKLYQMLAAGKLPTVEIDGIRRIPVAALEKWLADRTECAA